MLVHTVFFWLKPDVTDAQKAQFRAGLESLRAVECVKALYIGTPAPTDRPVVERSYSFAITAIFEDLAAQDAYQVHPVHKAFVSRLSNLWTRVVVYDAQ